MNNYTFRNEGEHDDMLDQLHEYVAQMCELFGDNRSEVACDAWRLLENITVQLRDDERLWNENQELLRQLQTDEHEHARKNLKLSERLDELAALAAACLDVLAKSNAVGWAHAEPYDRECATVWQDEADALVKRLKDATGK